MQEKQTDIGVVIGRFQLHEFHEAHIELIEQTFDQVRETANSYL